jgi:hypothetical protein
MALAGALTWLYFSYGSFGGKDKPLSLKRWDQLAKSQNEDFLATRNLIRFLCIKVVLF